MNHDDHTITSLVSPNLGGAAPLLLGMTILWHPDAERIGQQWLGLGSPGVESLNRFTPLFSALNTSGLPLAERSVSRTPLQLRRDVHDNIDIAVPDSQMSLQLNGAALKADTRLSREQIAAGAVLGLGGTILLCLHWASTLPKASSIREVLGVGSAAVRLRSLIAQVAATELPVLLLGETGTGKEVAAQAIHAASRRAEAPLVAVNMAALNESLAAADLFGAVKGAYTGAQQARQGLFAEAEHGTLFLDEIGNTPDVIQPMLLRVLESGEYRPLGAHAMQYSSARLIAATDQNLESTAFNQPLLRRLEGFVIRIPPLRERREDIGLLILHFLRLYAEQHEVPLPQLPFSLISEICNYDWPGNIRQLANLMRRVAVALTIDELPSFATLTGAGAGAGKTAPSATASVQPLAIRSRKKLEELGADEILAAMENHRWQIQAAAQALEISRPSLYKLLQSHPHIRPAHAIPLQELQAALVRHDYHLVRCASELRTPCEALRRHLRALGLLDQVTLED